MKNRIDFISSKESNCSASQTCDNVRFTTKLKVQETWVENKDLIFVVLENPEVQYHNSYISYDLISLIGEVGGILGITLGVSYSFCLFPYIQTWQMIRKVDHHKIFLNPYISEVVHKFLQSLRLCV